MNLTNQYKALLITVLFAGSVVLSVFNLSLKQQAERIAETYYEMEPEEPLTEEEIKLLEAIEKLNAAQKAETNKAFNESQDQKRFAQAYKPIAPPKDYVPTVNESSTSSESISKSSIDENSGLKNEELSSFDKVNDLLKQQQDGANNSSSTMSYSLVDRKLLNNPTPIYLCEKGGKIVVNITVNSRGEVTEAYINSASLSDNACLTEHAIEYAQQAIFDGSAKATQLGTITFFFIGKG